MKLSMTVNYSGGFKETADQVTGLEAAGLDIIQVAEAYSFDAISQLGFLAARTQRLELATGIINVFSRTPALIAMTAAGLDYVSGGRFILGLGTSGPQVIEGFHAVPYEKAVTRTREVIQACRMVWRREPLVLDGEAVKVPLPPGLGSGQGKPLKLVNQPVRSSIPIWWASLADRAVEGTAELANGWVPIFVIPEKIRQVWGASLDAGLARRPESLGPLDIVVTCAVAIGDHLPVDTIIDSLRPHLALYVGGMGSRQKNFYNELARRYGYEAEAARIQELYLSGHKQEAASELPRDWLEKMSLVGPAGYIQERLAAFKEAGVTVLGVNPVVGDPVRTVAALREMVDTV